MQVNQPSSLAIADSPKQLCPFGCGKAPHPFPSRKQDPDKDIISEPESLGGLPIKGCAPGKWGRARHHIIPAKQCFAKVRRLARMAMSIGYDINAAPNGIGLPTVENPYTRNGKTQNFGKFDPSVKEAIAYEAMEQTGKQWHVGNHHYDMPSAEESTNSMDDEGELDHHPYDEEVIKLLIKEMLEWDTTKLCQEKEDWSNEAKAAMDRISGQIRSKLDDFEYGGSRPFFVSVVALKFSNR